MAENTEVGLVEYEANGEKVKLSIPQIKKYLVAGGGNITDGEALMFLSLCKYQKLNPFLREAHCIKYGNSPATMVVSKDTYTKRAEAHPNYAGKQAGIIVIAKNGEIAEREGAFVLPSETIVGGWCKVFLKGHEAPEYSSVTFNEYAGRKSNGELNSQWATKPATMIRKVAVVQALREAFPDVCGGMYVDEEMQNNPVETQNTKKKASLNDVLKEEVVVDSVVVEDENANE